MDTTSKFRRDIFQGLEHTHTISAALCSLVHVKNTFGRSRHAGRANQSDSDSDREKPRRTRQKKKWNRFYFVAAMMLLLTNSIS